MFCIFIRRLAIFIFLDSGLSKVLPVLLALNWDPFEEKSDARLVGKSGRVKEKMDGKNC